MPATNPFDVYRAARRTAFLQLQQLRERMDAWLEANEKEPVSMSALALLEGLNSERDLAIRSLQAAEATLLAHLLGRMRPEDPQTTQTGLLQRRLCLVDEHLLEPAVLAVDAEVGDRRPRQPEAACTAR